MPASFTVGRVDRFVFLEKLVFGVRKQIDNGKRRMEGTNDISDYSIKQIWDCMKSQWVGYREAMISK